MSAECVIQALKQKHNVFGCDIYPAEWHIESAMCKKFFQAPLAKNQESYINFLLELCKENNINCICPLTDVEIDVINTNRSKFDDVLLAFPEKHVLEIVRNKENLYNYFKDDAIISTPETRTIINIDKSFFPCIAKPKNGRSSEGLFVLKKIEEKNILEDIDNYIFQKKIEGQIHTVDYVRFASQKKDFQIQREELIRTSNGAGLTVKITEDPQLSYIVSHIGNKLDINGCICMEFIKNAQGHYFLIDINPRFSAGVAFSFMAGYDFPNAHINALTNQKFPHPSELKKYGIIQKKYHEIVL